MKQRSDLAELVGLRLCASNHEDDQKVEEIFQSNNFSKQRRETSHLAPFLDDIIAHANPVSPGATYFVCKWKLISRSNIYIE